jgi:hypothetical protein
MSLDELERRGEKMTYGRTSEHINTRIHAFSGGYTRCRDLAEAGIITAFATLQELPLAGKDEPFFVYESDQELYVHPLYMHMYLSSTYDVHKYQVVAWTARIMRIHEHDQSTTLSMLAYLEFLAIATQNTKPDRVYEGEVSLNINFSSERQTSLVQCVMFCVFAPELSIQMRQTNFDTCIQIVVRWQGGDFDDLDTDREEIYVEGMLDTLLHVT